MNSTFKKFFKLNNSQDASEILKVIFLAISFFLIIGSYTVARELKDAIFANIIGSNRTYFSYAKMLALFGLIPMLFIHAKLIDKIKKYKILSIYTAAFGFMGVCFAFLLGHKDIGLYNTVTSPTRIIGWLFYLFVESYSPLIVSLFWALSNSITLPSKVKNNYTAIVSASKIGGILFSGTAYLVLKSCWIPDILGIQLLLGITSIFLLLVPVSIYYLIKLVPRKDLHGYEAAYIVNKEHRKKEHKGEQTESWFSGMTSGITMLFKYPYALGIFGMSFFFEIVNQVIKVENILFGKSFNNTMGGFASFLMGQALIVHIFGLFIVVLGTRFIINALGELKALILVPVVTGISIFLFITYQTWETALIAFVVTRAVNYALAVPLRESLYIPTIDEIRFKTKSWIDGMGTKFSKMASSSFNVYVDGLANGQKLTMQSIFFSITISCWLFIAYLLGKRFEKAVANNEVIGEDN